MNAAEAMKVAVEHHRAGRLPEAEKIYRQVLAAEPMHADALRLLGAIAIHCGHVDAGIDLIRRAIASEPGVADYFIDLGNGLRVKGKIEEALQAFREAVRLEPQNAVARSNLGVALSLTGKIDEAAAAFAEAARLKPDYAEAFSNWGNALRQKRDWEGAERACRAAIAIKPDFAEAYSNLGGALRGKECPEEAIAAYENAIRLRPGLAEAHTNLGNALKETGRFDDAIAAYRQAISIRPDLAAAHYNLGRTLLLTGDFENGWAEHEWRLKIGSWGANFPEQRRWNGEPLAGKTLLLWGEQGFGDVIQFFRYAKLAADRGGRIITWCQRELVPLLRENPDMGDVRAADEGIPDYDFHCALMSLPAVFATRCETIPRPKAYLHPNSRQTERWKKKLHDSSGALKVGLAWAGNPKFVDDRARSLTLDRLGSLWDTPGVKYFSFQKGAAAEQVKALPAKANFVDLQAELTDFAETAAAMSAMDLIITTDTAAAHLAGALGLPTWVMLQQVPDFRWMLAHDDSPWYASMRLFRQTSRGDWDGVIQRVANALAAQAKSSD